MTNTYSTKTDPTPNELTAEDFAGRGSKMEELNLI